MDDRDTMAQLYACCGRPAAIIGPAVVRNRTIQKPDRFILYFKWQCLHMASHCGEIIELSDDEKYAEAAVG